MLSFTHDCTPRRPHHGGRPRGATSRNLQSQGSSGSLGLGRALSLPCFQAPELWDVPSQVPTVQRQARRCTRGRSTTARRRGGRCLVIGNRNCPEGWSLIKETQVDYRT